MKLEAGMYVRYKNGIGKIVAKYVKGVLIDKDKGGYFRTENINIIKASHNIIDLIEVGDYVNGIRVGYINKGEDYLYALTDENTRDVICGYDSDEFTKPLHSIVTKEQFEQMEYKVDN